MPQLSQANLTRHNASQKRSGEVPIKDREAFPRRKQPVQKLSCYRALGSSKRRQGGKDYTGTSVGSERIMMNGYADKSREDCVGVVGWKT